MSSDVKVVHVSVILEVDCEIFLKNGTMSSAESIVRFSKPSSFQIEGRLLMAVARAEMISEIINMTRDVS